MKLLYNNTRFPPCAEATSIHGYTVYIRNVFNNYYIRHVRVDDLQ